MRPIPVIAPLCLWALAACGGPERPGRAPAQQDGPVAMALGDPPVHNTPVDAAPVHPTPDASYARLECETENSGEPDTGSVLNRNEIRTWARPGQLSGEPCGDTPDAEAGQSRGLETAVAEVVSSQVISRAASQAEDRAGMSGTGGPSPTAPVQIPLVPGLVLLSVHRFQDGDRENMVAVTEVSSSGVMYEWQLTQRNESGESFDEKVERFVRATDLAAAPRLNSLFTRRGRSDAPGYTAFSISRATYAQLRERGSAPYTVVSVQGGPFGEALSGVFMTRVTLKGTLSLASDELEAMPVLLNGRRVTVPVLRLKGRFAFQDRKEEGDYWVLADSVHPVLLRTTIGADTLQTVSIEVPGAEAHVERQLETVCRVELPGVYFAFASAELQSTSAAALAGVAELLKRHPAWSFAIEGHTDSIGDPAANHDLSVRRAQAVKAALVERHGISSVRLQAGGFGAVRPREPNATIEGRARNRRVELVRDCAGKQD